MASKIKVDQLETADGTGTIALQNQLSGLTSASMPTGSVLQVVTNKVTGNFSTSTQNTYVTTSQTLSITPASTSNKIMVMFGAVSVSTLAANTSITINVRRSGTTVASGSYYTAQQAGNHSPPFGTIHTLDSPSTTSAITYEVFAAEGGVPGTVTLNGPRELTLMEIAG